MITLFWSFITFSSEWIWNLDYSYNEDWQLMTLQRLLQVADQTRNVVPSNLRIICRCLVHNQDLRVMVCELFSGHCYSMPSPTIVCDLKWAVSSIKPPVLSSQYLRSTKHVKSALHSVLERMLLPKWAFFPSPPLPMTTYSPFCIWLLQIPSPRYNEAPWGWKVKGVLSNAISFSDAFLPECHVEDLIPTLFLWCIWQYNIL